MQLLKQRTLPHISLKPTLLSEKDVLMGYGSMTNSSQSSQSKIGVKEKKEKRGST
jgi:hypothetical protein